MGKKTVSVTPSETLPKHFSIDVPLDTEKKLLFNKNVVNF